MLLQRIENSQYMKKQSMTTLLENFSPWLELSPTTLELPGPEGVGFDEFPRAIPRFGQSPFIAPNNKILMLQDFDFATLCARVCCTYILCSTGRKRNWTSCSSPPRTYMSVWTWRCCCTSPLHNQSTSRLQTRKNRWIERYEQKNTSDWRDGFIRSKTDWFAFLRLGAGAGGISQLKLTLPAERNWTLDTITLVSNYNLANLLSTSNQNIISIFLMIMVIYTRLFGLVSVPFQQNLVGFWLEIISTSQIWSNLIKWVHNDTIKNKKNGEQRTDSRERRKAGTWRTDHSQGETVSSLSGIDTRIRKHYYSKARSFPFHK